MITSSWCSWNIYPASLFGLCIWSTYLFNSWLGVTYVSMEDIYLTLGLLHCSLKKDLWKLIGYVQDYSTSTGSQEKQESSRKTSASLTTPKPLTVWITTNYGKFFKRWEYQTTWPASWETCVQVKKQVRTRHGTTDWFQIGKGVHQGCILSPCLFNLYAEYIMRKTRWSTSWNQDCLEKYQSP